jgi:hypothetical protein
MRRRVILVDVLVIIAAPVIQLQLGIDELIRLVWHPPGAECRRRR